jgi:phenylacetate-CoA ligase
MTTLEQLSSLVAHATRPEGPRLYRTHYGMPENAPSLVLKEWNAWRSLPFISKAVLQDTPLVERIFMEWSEINSIHASSGTSGRPPHFSPWVRLDGYEYRLRFHAFTRPALCSMPIHHQHERFLAEQPAGARLIVFDPRRARASVELARLARADSLFIFTGHLALIGPEYERLGLGGDIRFIELAGESCSRALYRYARRVFPNAVIVSFYGATEVENPPITYPCRPLSDAEPLELHHPRDGYHLELIDAETQALLPIEPGVEGEIVLTADVTLPRPAMVAPLIRYRTGDMARVVEARCAAHGTWSFTMPGRVEMDFIKVPGGILRADELERVLSLFGETVNGHDFELHYSEVDAGDAVCIQLRLLLETTEPSLDEVSRRIERSLRIGAAFTYAEGIERGLYRPITCERFTPERRGKRRRMIRDTH